MQPPRITIRRLLLLVLLVAVALGVVRERRDRFRRIAAEYYPGSGGFGAGSLGHLRWSDRAGNPVPQD